MIVIHHFACHGTYLGNNYNSNLISTQFIYSILLIFGKVGVVTFVLIGAYFLCEKEFKWYRPINLFVQMVFYSYILFMIAILIDPKLKGLLTVKTFLFPIPLPSGYWFVNAYLIMLLTMPLLNLIIKNTNRNQLLLILCIIFIAWNILGLLGNLIPGKLEFSNSVNYNNFSNYTEANYFLYIYLLGSFLRKYPPKWFNSLKKSLELLIVSLIVVTLITIIFDNKEVYPLYANFAIQLNNPFSLMLAVSLFATFKNLSLGRIAIINAVAKSMFGVYLIHDNSFVRILLWHNLVDSNKYVQNGIEYFAIGVFYSLLVFIACILIDTIKRLLFDRYLSGLSRIISDEVIKFTKMV